MLNKWLDRIINETFLIEEKTELVEKSEEAKSPDDRRQRRGLIP